MLFKGTEHSLIPIFLQPDGETFNISNLYDLIQQYLQHEISKV